MNSIDLGKKPNEGIVYLATNNINGKIYVGITTRDLKTRVSEHKYDSLHRDGKTRTYFHTAMKKYGFDNFTFEILEKIYDDTPTGLISKLRSLEQYYIALLRSSNKSTGYNLTDGGEGVFGYKFSEQQRQEMSKARKGRHISDIHKERISEFMRSADNPHLGKHLSNETRKKISDARRGKFVGEANPMYGKKRPDLALRNLNSGYRVSQIDPESGDVIRTWDSLRKASQETGYARSCIADCCNQKVKLCHGYVWRYTI